MKKITLVLVTLLASVGVSFGQANILVKAPPGNNATTQVRAPNGNASHTTMRGCFLVTQAELTPYMLPGTNISTFGFTLTSGVTGSPVSGNFTVYLQNTNDATYLKGTSFATAIAPMSTNYTGNMTIPVSATSTSINLTLSTPFTYTGGGIYVAYDWLSSGPFSSTVATYMADNSLGVGGASNSTSVTPAVDAMTTTAFRPVYLFGAPNTATNDVQVVAVEAPGSIAGVLNTPHNIKAIIKNGSNTTLNNVPVSLNVSGANVFTDTQTITTIASGAQTTVTFTAFNPQISGVNTISVSVPTDQLPLNNSGTYSQSVTCNYMGQAPQPVTYTSGVGFSTGSGIIGARMIPPVTTTCNGIRIGLSNDAASVGKSIWGVLLNASGAILATTNTITITAPLQATAQNFTFATPQNLTSGTTYYLGMAQPAGTPAYFPLGAQTSGYIPANLYVTTFTTGGTPTSLTQNLGYFGLEAIIAHNTTVSAVASSPTVCAGSTVSLTGSGVSTYSWSTGGTGSVVVVTPTAATVNYSVIGSTGVGCTATASLSVSTIASPTVSSLATNTIVCSGGSSSLSANGADTYSWSTGGSTQGITVNPTVTTTYSVVGTSTTTGCTANSTVSVAVDIPTISISSPSAICSGTAAPLIASGASSYSWSTGSISSSVAVNPTVTTNYVVTGTTSAGCVGTQSVTLIVNTPPSLTLNALPATSVCAGSQFTLTYSGGSNYTVASSWNGTLTASGSATNITNGVVYSPTVTSIYTVTGTYSTNTCASTKTLNVTVASCTGINELTKAGTSVSIYPNPNNGVLNVNLDNVANNTSIEVYNMLGEMIKQYKVVSENTIINLQDKNAGVYIVRLTENGKMTYTYRIIKQ